MTKLFFLRLAKLWASLIRPRYWSALSFGVAPAVEHRKVLRSLKVDGVIDVGANRGQFALACRYLLPGVPVVSFEPIPTEADVFERVHGGTPWVTLVRTALGENKGTAVLHMSQSADSSSLLPIGERQTELFKNTAEVGTLEVSVNRLDDFGHCWYGRGRQLLKIDVQGYELNVLKGATETLASCRYVYAECSEVALYEGQALRAEVQALLSGHGFILRQRVNEQVHDGNLIQADYLFERA